MLWHIPLRNLFRNRRRTLLGLAIIALGTAMIYAVLGYVDFTLYNIRQGTVRQFGNFQIASPLLWNEKTEKFAYLIQPDTLKKVQAILDEQEGVRFHSEQLSFSGLATTGTKTKVLRSTALVPANKALDYNDLVLTDYKERPEWNGQGLDSTDTGKVLIGRTLAKELQLKTGDFFTVTTTTVDGAYNVGTLQVKGIFSLNNEIAEGQLVFLPLEYGKLLMDTAGIAKIIIKVDRLEDSERIAAEVQAKMRAAGLELEVRTWEQLAEFYRQIKGFFNALFGFLMIAVSILVFFIVMQVLTLAFLERTREVGTIRAIGTKQSQVFSMFFSESVMLGLLGSFVGIILGWALAQGFNSLGIGWTPPGAITPVPVRLSTTLSNAWMPFIVTAIATILSSLYPVSHSARLTIVDALRTS
jgi:putative ABC transport system permease protein